MEYRRKLAAVCGVVSMNNPYFPVKSTQQPLFSFEIYSFLHLNCPKSIYKGAFAVYSHSCTRVCQFTLNYGSSALINTKQRIIFNCNIRNTIQYNYKSHKLLMTHPSVLYLSQKLNDLYLHVPLTFIWYDIQFKAVSCYFLLYNYTENSAYI